MYLHKSRSRAFCKYTQKAILQNSLNTDALSGDRDIRGIRYLIWIFLFGVTFLTFSFSNVRPVIAVDTASTIKTSIKSKISFNSKTSIKTKTSNTSEMNPASFFFHTMLSLYLSPWTPNGGPQPNPAGFLVDCRPIGVVQNCEASRDLGFRVWVQRLDIARNR